MPCLVEAGQESGVRVGLSVECGFCETVLNRPRQDRVSKQIREEKNIVGNDRRKQIEEKEKNRKCSK